ncbi:MAG: HlyD family efflux transporter periplasmic adaptor subunit [Caulobacterales bacterium]|nr:HlyD family efflux transporter periplasmic adaptor subunit [Caulobacterales bacterium]
MSGSITPSLGSVRLTTAKAGTLREIYAAEGDVVQAGQAVGLMDYSSSVLTGDAYDLLARNVSERSDAARSLDEASRTALNSEEARLLSSRMSLRSEIEEMRRLEELQQERLQLARSEVERAEAIATKGFLPQRELDLRRGAVLVEQQGLSQTARALIGLERQLGDVEARLRLIPAELQSLASRNRTAAAELSREQTENEAAMVQRLVAPMTGRVAALIAHPGQSLPAGAAVAMIIPNGSELEAELYIPTRAAGFVRPGQRVKLFYDAFPAERYGAGEGVVSSMSRTALAPEDLRGVDRQITEPVFRATVRLRSEDVLAYNERIRLQPGMSLRAEINMGKRSLMQWLLDPLFAVGRGSR